MLAPFGNYGGSTQTMMPLPGSSLVNAATGSTATIDQRGFPRSGTRDIGAVEFQGNTEYPRIWNLDTDGDGISFGVEFALDTDNAVSDTSSPNHFGMTKSNPNRTVMFGGGNEQVSAHTTLKVDRSDQARQQIRRGAALNNSRTALMWRGLLFREGEW